jgi:hypothetical protein
MTDPLHQMNISYVATEDRLLLRASTRAGDEYRIWLTRRFCSLLTGIVQKQMEQFGGAPVLASSNQTRALFKHGAMEKKFEAENSSNFPLGESGILAHRINSRINEDGTLALQLLPGTGEGITLNLNQTLLYMFYNLLAQGMEQAEWHLGQAHPDAKLH